MILSMSGQAWLFLTMVCVGAAVGLFYDAFRVLRATAPHKHWVVQLEDAFFWLAATVLVFYYMLHRNYGEIRVFVLIGIIAGAALYFCTLSRWVLLVAVAVVEYLKRVIAAALRILFLPLGLLLAWLTPPIKKATRHTRKRLHSLGRYGKIRAKKATRNWTVLRKKI